MNIDDEIITYITSKESNGALLLTGKWGSGKTYLINDISKKINKEANHAIISVSLFGIENTIELNRKIKEIIFHYKTNKDINNEFKQKISGLKNVTSVLSAYSNIAKGVNAALSIDLYDFISVENQIEIIGKKVLKKNLVLVFDDFERSKIDVINLMGAINDYHENKKIKIIIIADETKIKQEDYKVFKEKLVFRTLKMIPNNLTIVNNIISQYSETTDGYSEFLNKNRDVIEQVFNESRLDNIRSLKSIIIDFERVYASWLSSDIAKDHMRNVLYTFGSSFFEFRAGNFKETDYGRYYLESAEFKAKYSSFGDKASQFSSLLSWITTGEWNENAFEEELKSKYGSKNITDVEKFLYYNLWDLKYEIVIKGFNSAINMAYLGDMSLNDLILLLQKIHALTVNGVDLLIEPKYEDIMLGLVRREELIKLGELIEHQVHTFISEETLLEMPEEVVELYNNINKFEFRTTAWQNRIEFIDFLKEESVFTTFDAVGKYIVSFDDYLLDLFLDKYISGENRKKKKYAMALTNLKLTDDRCSYKEDIYVSKKNFIELASKLESMNKIEGDEITKVITHEHIKLIRKFMVGLE